jgi:hypothetical protein
MKTMPDNKAKTPPKLDATDVDLALWMLDRMRHSETDLGIIRAARSAGGTDILDTPEHVALHKKRIAPLYRGETDAVIEAPESVIAMLEKLSKRDLLSCNEELFEKAIAAYIAKHPKGGDGLPVEWLSPFDAAQAEIEGRTSGAFKPGFTAELATAARAEIARRNGLEQGSTRDRGDDRGS